MYVESGEVGEVTDGKNSLLSSMGNLKFIEDLRV